MTEEAAAPGADPLARTRALRSLQIDAITAEVVGELERRGLRALLLKGAAVARWLYDETGARTYRDCDLLVDPATVPAVHAALTALGFREILPDRAMPGWLRPAHLWVRDRDRAAVDLHTSIWGVPAPAERVWSALARETARLTVAGRTVEALSPPAAAMHLALHAAQHGGTFASAAADLHRALTVLPIGAWRAAASLAAELDAAGAFAAGLRMLPAGAAVADELGLHAPAPAETLLRARNAGPTALGWEQLVRARGLRARASLIRWAVFPTRQFMVAWSPGAASGRRAMAAARLRRVAWLTRRALPGLLAWRRARRPPLR